MRKYYLYNKDLGFLCHGDKFCSFPDVNIDNEILFFDTVQECRAYGKNISYKNSCEIQIRFCDNFNKNFIQKDNLSSIILEQTKIGGKSIMEQADEVLKNRRGVNKNREDSFGVIASYWSAYLKQVLRMEVTGQILSDTNVLDMMVLFKEARKICQETNIDNWIDSINYNRISAEKVFGKEVNGD